MIGFGDWMLIEINQQSLRNVYALIVQINIIFSLSILWIDR
jgi:hypothetical protein